LPVRVVHFKSRYLNASETFIDRLVRNHARYTPAVATVEPGEYTEGLEVYAPHGPLAQRLNTAARKLNAAPPVLFEAVRRARPEVLHAHFGLDGFRALALARRVPLVVSFYGSDASRLPNEPGWARRYRHLAAGASAFTTVSSEMRDTLITMGFPPERTHVVWMGLDVEAFPFHSRTEAGLRLLAVGRLVEKKGFVDAISALYHLRQSGHDATLRIVGDGPERDALERHAGRLGIRGFVRFEGALPNDAIRAAFDTADVLLVPSVTAPDGDREGMPNTILEGLAAGIPIVATTHAGISEVIEDGKTGLLTPEHASEAIAAAVLRYCDAPHLAARVSRDGRARIEQDFTVEAYVARTEKVYDAARRGG